MKKVLALIIMLALLLEMVSGALATDEEITFLGIPWGSSQEEVNAILKEKELLSYAKRLEKEKGHCLLLFNDKIVCRRSAWQGWAGFDNYDNWIGAAECSKIVKPVDGYYLKNLTLSYCIDDENTQFICASFGVNDKNLSAAYNNLKGKFNQNYGEGEEITGPDYGDGNYTMCYWKGADNTAIYLEYYIDRNELTVYYGTMKAEELFKEASQGKN